MCHRGRGQPANCKFFPHARLGGSHRPDSLGAAIMRVCPHLCARLRDSSFIAPWHPGPRAASGPQCQPQLFSNVSWCLFTRAGIKGAFDREATNSKLRWVDTARPIRKVARMEALAEQIVATYLTRGGTVFIAPQYAIPSPNGKGDWACPDFVALDFDKREIVVVEVATGSRFSGLAGRVSERNSRWFGPIRAKLEADGLIEQAQWDFRFLGFVRSDCLDQATKQFSGQDRVAFKAIEEATFPWAYWEDRKTEGLPR